MIENIIKSFEEKITNIGWIERYGGLVKPVKRTFAIDDSLIVKTFPVACGVNAKECWEKGKYQDLIPNDKYKSLAYWEQRGSVSCSYQRVDGDKYMCIFSAPVSFVCWLNMPKLGFDDCTSSHLFEAHMLKVLSKVGVVTSPYQINNLKCVIDGLAPKNETIFQKYSYDDREDLLMYPFDFFSINMTFSWGVLLNCIPDVELSTPISCVTL
jgi:hypothetical protein